MASFQNCKIQFLGCTQISFRFFISLLSHVNFLSEVFGNQLLGIHTASRRKQALGERQPTVPFLLKCGDYSKWPWRS